MSLNSELSKIKEAFSKVRKDMLSLSSQIGENYDEFMKKHKSLSEKVETLSDELKEHVKSIKNTYLTHDSSVSNADILYLKTQIKELKDEVSELHTHHFNVSKVVDDLKKEKNDVKQLKEKLHSSELEIFLLKERLSEKDTEIRQLKDVSKTIFDVLDELSKVELDMLNLTYKKQK